MNNVLKDRILTGGGKRESNFELLRIVAMFLVLIVHADFFSLGRPNLTNLIEHPVSSYMRYFVEMLALVCVNVFIIISGYFGIKVRLKSVCNFIFMVLFWRIVLTVSFLLASHFGLIELNISIQRTMKLFIPGFDDWFVASYILLLFLSPILNSYIEKVSTRQLWTFVILYVGLQICLSTVLQIYTEFHKGYSVLSFIGLYLLGSAIRKSDNKLKKKISYPLVGYLIVCAVAASIFFVFSLKYKVILEHFEAALTAYNSLPILLASFLLFMFFAKLSFRSKVVNYIAASSFAVYLFHMYPLMREYYARVCRYLFDAYDTWEYIGLVLLFIIAVYTFATVVDIFRRWLWSLIAGYFDRQ